MISIDSRYRQGKVISFHQSVLSTTPFQTRNFCNDKVDNDIAINVNVIGSIAA